MIEKIEHQSELLAIIIRSGFRQDGISFFTPDNFSQQLAYMKREKGYLIKPHVHNPVERNVSYTKEVLFIKSGKVRLDFYDNQKCYLNSTILNEKDVVLLAYGGHGFFMIEESEIIEVKQGPYAGEADKTRFESIDESRIIIRE